MTTSTPKKIIHLSSNGKPLIVAKLYPNYSQNAEKWLEQNRTGIKEYNQWILKNRVFSDGLRLF